MCSGSPLVAEICAGSGLDWVLIDMEHSPNGLESVLAQLQAVAAYPVTPLVRVPIGDVVTIKQVLDLGAQNLLVPMVSSADEARAVVEAVRYPPRGRRGVGSALARSARWNRVDGYLTDADAHVSLFVQIETAEGVAAAAEIAAVDGVDGVFVGPVRPRRVDGSSSVSRATRTSSPPSGAPSRPCGRPASRSASTRSTRPSRARTSTPGPPSCSSAPTSRSSRAARRRSPPRSCPPPDDGARASY